MHEKDMQKKHQHPEAYCLLPYAILGHEERETIWNSRDGVAPSLISPQSGLGELVYLKDADKTYAPTHLPALGARIIVDVTEVRGRQMAEDRVARWELRESEGRVPLGIPLLRVLFRSRAECVEAVFQTTFDPTAPDIVVVNAGYIQRLLAIREGFLPAESRAMAPKTPPKAKTKNPLIHELSFAHMIGKQPSAATVTKLVGRLSVAEFVRTMSWIEDHDNASFLETKCGNLCVSTWRIVDNTFGAVPRAYYESQLIQDDDPGQYWILGEPVVFYATEDEARCGHAAMVERVQRALNPN